MVIDNRIFAQYKPGPGEVYYLYQVEDYCSAVGTLFVAAQNGYDRISVKLVKAGEPDDDKQFILRDCDLNGNVPIYLQQIHLTQGDAIRIYSTTGDCSYTFTGELYRETYYVAPQAAANYLVRYIWTAAAGRDLDTYTYVQIGGQRVGGITGYSYGSSAGATNPATGQFLPFLSWSSGDSTSQGGEENVTVNVQNIYDYIEAANPPGQTAAIYCGAHWYGAPGTGMVTLRAQPVGSTGTILQKDVLVVTRYNSPQLLGLVGLNNGPIRFL